MKITIKHYLYCLLIVAYCSCHSPKADKIAFPQNSRIQLVNLIDSFGSILLSIPNRYDTSFLWVHHSDCGDGCDEQKYRFQPKLLPILKETGWYVSNEPKDSVERITIIHSRLYRPFDGRYDTTKGSIDSYHKHQLSRNSLYEPIVFDTIQKIGDRYYSIVAIQKSGQCIQKRGASNN